MRTCIDFNDNWALFLNASPLEDNTATPDESVNLPHITDCSLASSSREKTIAGIWYVKNLSMTPDMQEQKLFLECGYAAYSASVYINGTAILHHSGAGTLFREDITSYLTQPENQIAIHVSSDESVMEKTSSDPDYIGIAGKVRLILVGDTHFDLTFLGSDGFMITPIVKENMALLRLISYINNPSENQTVLYEIFDHNGACVASVTSSALCASASLSLPSPHLWNGTADPYLYTAKASILYRNIELDSVTIRFGIRSYHIDDDLGFFLNGMAYPLRLPSNKESCLSFQSNDTADVMRKCLTEAKAKGITYLNEVPAIHCATFYELLDELGIIASADLFFPSDFLMNAASQKDCLAKMNELIVQTYNHPSICFYGISNRILLDQEEEESLEDFRRFCSSLKRLDSSRKFTFPCLCVNDLEFAKIRYDQILNYCYSMGWYIR
ncbi:MAG: hypothetical protein E7256_06950 [Lachnospiraceae bacterium]|nr:hypothetical protein [Lachnospiraceae bacterium]